MNGSKAEITKIVEHLAKADLDPNAEVIIAPPSLYLFHAASALGSNTHIKVAAQNVYHLPNGAHTGEISVQQLKGDGIEWVILGHSERRAKNTINETDDKVAAKTKAALDGGLKVVLCIGESEQEREAGETVKVVVRQLDAVRKVVKNWESIVIAYEPIWAIGTGKTATTQQAQEVHADIRKWLSEQTSGSDPISPSNAAESVRIIYGGSVTEKNSRELAQQPDIDGFLVGGASLKPAFVDIINSTR